MSTMTGYWTCGISFHLTEKEIGSERLPMAAWLIEEPVPIGALALCPSCAPLPAPSTLQHVHSGDQLPKSRATYVFPAALCSEPVWPCSSTRLLSLGFPATFPPPFLLAPKIICPIHFKVYQQNLLIGGTDSPISGKALCSFLL